MRIRNPKRQVSRQKVKAVKQQAKLIPRSVKKQVGKSNKAVLRGAHHDNKAETAFTNLGRKYHDKRSAKHKETYKTAQKNIDAWRVTQNTPQSRANRRGGVSETRSFGRSGKRAKAF